MTPLELLDQPLDPRNIKPPAPGKYGEYLEAWFVIEEANRIFGRDGWSYEVCEIRLTNETQDAESKWHVGYFATVRVDALDRSKSDVGHGQGHGRSHGDAHDSAVKEAATDALKRALRTFGNPLGLALYDKQKSGVGYVANEAEVAAVKVNIQGQSTLADLATYWTKLNETQRHIAASADVQAAKDTRKAELEKDAT